MLYDELIHYDSDYITYDGVLILNISGITNPVRVNDVKLVIVGDVDYSNFTYAGTVQIDVIPTSEILISLTDIQASAIMDMDVVNISVGAESYSLIMDVIATAESQTTSTSNQDNSEISVINISTQGSLLIPNS